MEILKKINTFLKDQTGGEKTIGEAIDESKKTIALIATTATIASTSPVFSQEQNTQIPSSQTTISQETPNSIDNFKTLTPIATAEDIYESNKWNQSIMAEYYNALNPNDESKYLYLGLPSSIGLKGDASLALNNGRADYYKAFTVPGFAWEGLYKDDPNSTSGLKIIKEGLSKPINQFAKIELGSEQEGFYTIKVTGTDDRLGKKNIYLNAIVFKDEVNVENNKDDFGTRIVKRVAYKYCFGTALGKSFSKIERRRVFFDSEEA